jgi:enoyl-CoA hydratase/carnithine racemase
MATLQRDGDVFLLDLGDGENRLNGESVASLEECLEEVEAAAPCALVTHAGGKVWSNGLDLEWIAAQGEDAPLFLARVHELFARLLELGVPTVAAMQGHVFAGGAMLALAHDARVMRADRGWFCLPEVDLGIPFTPGMSALIASKLSPQLAHRTMVLGERFGGSEAQAAGIVEHAVAEQEVLPAARAQALALAGKDPGAMRAIKRALYESALDALRAPVSMPVAL